MRTCRGTFEIDGTIMKHDLVEVPLGSSTAVFRSSAPIVGFLLRLPSGVPVFQTYDPGGTPVRSTRAHILKARKSESFIKTVADHLPKRRAADANIRIVRPTVASAAVDRPGTYGYRCRAIYVRLDSVRYKIRTVQFSVSARGALVLPTCTLLRVRGAVAAGDGRCAVRVRRGAQMNSRHVALSRPLQAHRIACRRPHS